MTNEENFTTETTAVEKTEQKKPNLKKLITLIAVGVVVLVAVLITVLAIINNNSPTEIAKAATKAFLDCDYKKAEKRFLVTSKMEIDFSANCLDYTEEEYLEDFYDVSSFKEYYDEMNEEIRDELYDEYGDYKYVIRKVKEDHATSKEYKQYIEDWEESSYERYYDILADDISDMTTVEVKVRINGEDNSETVTFTYEMVKYKGKWYIVDFEDW